MPFRDLNFHSSPSHYAFTSPSTPSAPTLVIERPTGDIRLNNGPLPGSRRISSVAGILGIIRLRLDRYIILITKAQPVGKIRGQTIYKVVSIDFFQLRERPLHDPDEDAYITILQGLLKESPMYFSYDYDLTNSAQRQSQGDPSTSLWRRADDRFFWNRFIQTDLIDFRGGVTPRKVAADPAAVDPYILPVMFGMLRVTQTAIKGEAVNFILITRRSRFRAGTRFFSRGIDDDGHVSNFNETEQLLILNESSGGLGGYDLQSAKSIGQRAQVLSYVQTRGSVPIFWSDVNNLRYVPELKVKPASSARQAAAKHFREQITTYGDNYLVNLVNQKGRENLVKLGYEELVRLLVEAPSEKSEGDSQSSEAVHAVENTGGRYEFSKLHYVYFDFHNETKGLKWHRAQILLDQLQEALVQQQYYLGAQTPQGPLQTQRMQTSVVRTNCMDCLDRTNVVQSMLARAAIDRMLIDLGIFKPGDTIALDANFQKLFRNVWADNADTVSKAYSGTGALKTDFTRLGIRTNQGMFNDFSNSLTRYARQNFGDGPRQDAFDLFLGVYLPSPSGVRKFMDRRPLLIQAIPYVFGASLFMIAVAICTPRLPDAAVVPLRFFMVFWFGVAAWSMNFIQGHGMLYVNWPKLNPLSTASEGYNHTLDDVRNDKVLGGFMKHERGVSTARMSYLEEGKKRIE